MIGPHAITSPERSTPGVEQQIVYARAALWAPFYAVGMAARVEGAIDPQQAAEALRKLAALHPALASRVRIEQNGAAWLTTQGVSPFPLQVRARTGDDDWSALLLEQERLPFAFARGPLARFYLLRGERCSDLVVLAPHVICDGYSMTCAMGDAITLLNNPDAEIRPPVVATDVSWNTMPHRPHDVLGARALVRLVNLLWRRAGQPLEQQAYEQLHQAYWADRRNGLLIATLTAAETARVLARCREHHVALTGALMAAALLASGDNDAALRSGRKASIAVNTRDRLTPAPGAALGVYASSFDIGLPRGRLGFWELATSCHARIHRTLRRQAALLLPLALADLDPRIADALITALATDRWKTVFGLAARLGGLKNRNRALAVSNIGRVQLPDVGRPHRLCQMLPFPPVVVGSQLILNALTVGGELTILLKYRLEDCAGRDMAALRDQAVSLLLGV